MDSKVVVAVEAYEVVAVTLVVTQEDVLAMHRAIVLPPAAGLLYGLAFGMGVTGIFYSVLVKVCQHLVHSFFVEHGGVGG